MSTIRIRRVEPVVRPEFSLASGETVLREFGHIEVEVIDDKDGRAGPLARAAAVEAFRDLWDRLLADIAEHEGQSDELQPIVTEAHGDVTITLPPDVART